MKIGIFSGTFDPIHDGHVSLANEAIKRANLEKVIFLPEPTPRRKVNVSPIEQRVQMIRLVIDKNAQLEVYISRHDYHSTVETMKELEEVYGDNQYSLIMGVDVYEHLKSWKDYRQLLKNNEIILGLRTEDDGETAVELSGELGISPTMVISKYPKLSSSLFRSDIETEGIDPKVRSYIVKNHLYE